MRPVYAPAPVRRKWHEVRRHPRFYCDVRLTVVCFRGDKRRFWGRASDICEQGLAATIVGELDVNEVVSVELRLPLPQSVLYLGVTLGGLCALLAMPAALLSIPHDCPSDLFFRPIFTMVFLGMLTFSIGWLVVFRVRRMMRQTKSKHTPKRHTPIAVFAARKRHPFAGFLEHCS